ncbi:MAG: response regulator [Acidobacteria bacterium]|nr:response regulator [Acidobacteriota bacterium]
MTVLIVDDNAGVRRFLRAVIGDFATRMWDCIDGADALDAYVTHRPAIVLMDIRMPRLDGLAATRLILSADPSAKVVIVTDYDDEMLRAAARDAGACAYVTKSNLLDLAAVLLSLLP